MDYHRIDQMERAVDFVKNKLGTDAPAILADIEGDIATEDIFERECKVILYSNRRLNNYALTRDGIYTREKTMNIDEVCERDSCFSRIFTLSDAKDIDVALETEQLGELEIGYAFAGSRNMAFVVYLPSQERYEIEDFPEEISLIHEMAHVVLFSNRDLLGDYRSHLDRGIKTVADEAICSYLELECLRKYDPQSVPSWIKTRQNATDDSSDQMHREAWQIVFNPKGSRPEMDFEGILGRIRERNLK